MAVQVVMGRRQQSQQRSSVEENPLARMLTIGGAIAGGVTGGPAGAAQGASLGQMAGGLIAPPSVNQPKQQVQQDVGAVQTGGDQMKRRLGEIDNSNLNQIAQSIDSLKFVQDDDLRLKMAQPLLQAYQLAEKQG